jgi:hypothetical protein
MGITLRWRVEPFDCEFHLDGGSGWLVMRSEGLAVAQEAAPTARAAHQRASDLADMLRSPEAGLTRGTRGTRASSG